MRGNADVYSPKYRPDDFRFSALISWSSSAWKRRAGGMAPRRRVKRGGRAGRYTDGGMTRHVRTMQNYDVLSWLATLSIPSRCVTWDLNRLNWTNKLKLNDSMLQSMNEVRDEAKFESGGEGGVRMGMVNSVWAYVGWEVRVGIGRLEVWRSRTGQFLWGRSLVGIISRLRLHIYVYIYIDIQRFSPDCGSTIHESSSISGIHMSHMLGLHGSE